jgi:hypothetical protein
MVIPMQATIRIHQARQLRGILIYRGDLQPALSARSYHDPNSLSAVSRQQFEVKVRKYLYQLTVGCGSPGCRNRFCNSCPGRMKAMAAWLRSAIWSLACDTAPMWVGVCTQQFFPLHLSRWRKTGSRSCCNHGNPTCVAHKDLSLPFDATA